MLCAAGTFKAEAGAEECSECRPGKFSSSVGATEEATCLDCGAGKYSSTHGAVAASSCIECNAGKYSEDSGASSASSCLECRAGTFSNRAGASEESDCSACPQHSDSPAGSTAAAACTCNAGASGPNGGVCKLCFAGKFKALAGPEACMDCDGGTYLAAVGASAASYGLRTSQDQYTVLEPTKILCLLL